MGVISGWASECGQWGWTYCLPHNDVFLHLFVLFDNRIPTFSKMFVNYFPFLFLFHFLDFSNLRRERIILEYFQHLAIRGVHQGQ